MYIHRSCFLNIYKSMHIKDRIASGEKKKLVQKEVSRNVVRECAKFMLDMHLQVPKKKRYMYDSYCYRHGGRCPIFPPHLHSRACKGAVAGFVCLDWSRTIHCF